MESFSMKDEAFNEKGVRALAKRLKQSWSAFEEERFISLVMQELLALELKERALHITAVLTQLLPSEYERTVEILLNSLGEESNVELSGYDGFMVMPLTHYVAQHGLEEFELSMHALKEMSKRFTSEFDIRFFIERYEAECLDLFHTWVEDENLHVRRLVSEGTRTRLPWAFRLKRFVQDPSAIVELLSKLRHDSELYVRRSVANNLNDISKDNPEVVLDTLENWQDGSKEVSWITSHALRTLLKQGEPRALKLVGFDVKAKVEVKTFSLKKERICLGESLEFFLELESKESAGVMVDFVIYFQKANGTLSPKVFKWSKKKLAKNECLQLHKKHAFKEYTTRKHYSGKHVISVQVNGKELNKQEFILEC